MTPDSDRRPAAPAYPDGATRILFALLLVAVLAAAYLVIAPFLTGFVWAAVVAATFRPFHQRLERTFGGRRWAATMTVTLLVAAFVVVPIVAAAIQAVQAGVAAVHWVQTSYESGGNDLGLRDRWPWIEDAIGRVKELVGLANVDLRAMAASQLKMLATLVSEKGAALVGGAFGVAFSFAMMLVGVPLLFANGAWFRQAVAEALPIPTTEARRIFDDLVLMTRSMFISMGVTAAAQAALGGIALFFLGVPQAMSLTAVMFFFALIPAGTAVVWVPAAIWLAATGNPGKAVILAAWGAGIVSTIDNVLRPLLAESGTKLSGVTLFIGMFGGMAAFGLVGLFLGPIVLYLAHELLAILRRDIYHTQPD